MGTACHVRGATGVLEEFQNKLSVEAGGTTDDNRFTLETVNCLGCCAVGPVMVIDGNYHGEMTPQRVEAVIEGYS